MATKSNNSKFYVVWSGRNIGIFDNWQDCLDSVKQYKGAIYKAYRTKEEAQAAFMQDPKLAINSSKPKKEASNTSKTANKKTNKEASAHVPTTGIAVDGAASGNPGPSEYQAIDLATGEVFFKVPPFMATNNIVEFLAIVHAMALLMQKNRTDTIYSDSKIAIKWINTGKCATTIPCNEKFSQAHQLIERAEKWLSLHPKEMRPQLVKWETDSWGENPADYGRK